MATSAGGGKEKTLPRMPSKLAWLGAGPRRGKLSLGTVDPAFSGFSGLYGLTGIPLQPYYIRHQGLCLQTGLPG